MINFSSTSFKLSSKMSRQAHYNYLSPITGTENFLYALVPHLFPQKTSHPQKIKIKQITENVRRLAGNGKVTGTPGTDWTLHGKSPSFPGTLFVSYRNSNILKINHATFLPCWMPSNPFDMISHVLSDGDGNLLKRAKLFLILWRLLEEGRTTPMLCALIISIMSELTSELGVSISSITLLNMFATRPTQKSNSVFLVTRFQYLKFDINNQSEVDETAWFILSQSLNKMGYGLMSKENFFTLTRPQMYVPFDAICGNDIWNAFQTGNITGRALYTEGQIFTQTIFGHILSDSGPDVMFEFTPNRIEKVKVGSSATRTDFSSASVPNTTNSVATVSKKPVNRSRRKNRVNSNSEKSDELSMLSMDDASSSNDSLQRAAISDQQSTASGNRRGNREAVKSNYKITLVPQLVEKNYNNHGTFRLNRNQTGLFNGSASTPTLVSSEFDNVFDEYSRIQEPSTSAESSFNKIPSVIDDTSTNAVKPAVTVKIDNSFEELVNNEIQESMFSFSAGAGSVDETSVPTTVEKPENVDNSKASMDNSAESLSESGSEKNSPTSSHSTVLSPKRRRKL